MKPDTFDSITIHIDGHSKNQNNQPPSFRPPSAALSISPLAFLVCGPSSSPFYIFIFSILLSTFSFT